VRLFLARHGETAWNLEQRWQGHTDIPLSDRGREQALALAGRVRGLGIGLVRSSDLLRARETAAIVARELGLPEPVADPRLRERSFGVFEGLTAAECAHLHPEAWARHQADRTMPPGGEPGEQVVARLQAGLQDALADAAGMEALLLVGHGGATRALLAACFGRPFPPMANGCLFRAEVSGGVLTQIEDLGAG
jgi:broad specificity phosphatase PhoE